jgi:hypothetical protein
MTAGFTIAYEALGDAPAAWSAAPTGDLEESTT